MGLGTNLKKILKDKDMTIKELSKKSGVSINTLYSITKRDNNAARYDIVQKIASALDVTAKELTGYDIDESKIGEKNVRLYEVIKRNSTNNIDKNNLKSLESIVMPVVDSIIDSLLESYVDDKATEINNLLNQLNDAGKEKAIELTELITRIPEYKKEPDEPYSSQTESDPDDTPQD